jgi:hypothetical protein
LNLAFGSFLLLLAAAGASAPGHAHVRRFAPEAARAFKVDGIGFLMDYAMSRDVRFSEPYGLRNTLWRLGEELVGSKRARNRLHGRLAELRFASSDGMQLRNYPRPDVVAADRAISGLAAVLEEAGIVFGDDEIVREAKLWELTGLERPDLSTGDHPRDFWSVGLRKIVAYSLARSAGQPLGTSGTELMLDTLGRDLLDETQLAAVGQIVRNRSLNVARFSGTYSKDRAESLMAVARLIFELALDGPVTDAELASGAALARALARRSCPSRLGPGDPPGQPG